jgi:hypothetical protein
MYGAPVWIEALEKECNETIYNRVQRLINIKTAKAFRTTSNEALCTLTGLTPIVRKTGFVLQTQSESLNNKMSTPYKYLQTAARAGTGRSCNSNIYSE